MTAPVGPVDVVAVVIPARNEQQLLPRCLAAVTTAVGHVAQTGEPVVQLLGVRPPPGR